MKRETFNEKFEALRRWADAAGVDALWDTTQGEGDAASHAQDRPTIILVDKSRLLFTSSAKAYFEGQENAVAVRFRLG